jgi:hypothetical protein
LGEKAQEMPGDLAGVVVFLGCAMVSLPQADFVFGVVKRFFSGLRP